MCVCLLPTSHQHPALTFHHRLSHKARDVFLLILPAVESFWYWARKMERVMSLCRASERKWGWSDQTLLVMTSCLLYIFKAGQNCVCIHCLWPYIYDFSAIYNPYTLHIYGHGQPWKSDLGMTCRLCWAPPSVHRSEQRRLCWAPPSVHRSEQRRLCWAPPSVHTTKRTQDWAT